jgi:hypothetical protein
VCVLLSIVITITVVIATDSLYNYLFYDGIVCGGVFLAYEIFVWFVKLYAIRPAEEVHRKMEEYENEIRNEE